MTSFQNPTGQEPLWATEAELAEAPLVESYTDRQAVEEALGLLNGAMVNFSFALLDASRLLEAGPR